MILSFPCLSFQKRQILNFIQKFIGRNFENKVKVASANSVGNISSFINNRVSHDSIVTK